MINQLNAIATTYGNNLVFIDTSSSGATINGTPIRQGGTANNITTFNIAGDLNLGASDAIVAAGTTPIQLNVAANANIASGARISADALGGAAGAGGGAAGTAGLRPDGPRATLPGISGNNPDAAAPTAPNHDGHDGYDGTSPTMVFIDAISSYAGTAGAAGVNTSVSAAAGGAGRVPGYSLPLFGRHGVHGIYDHASGDGTDGTDGTKGGDGAAGVIGKPGQAGQNTGFVLHGGGGGGGGSSGGDGIAGAGSGQGGSGGGGFQNGSDIIIFGSSPSSYGGGAGSGSDGNPGTKGFNGGNGGAGGGGIGITVGGALVLNGVVTASGADGTNAQYDVFEHSTQVQHSGGMSGGTNLFGFHGGNGGLSPAGGQGGLGGTGGGGGGGAGGSIFVVASSYSPAGTTSLSATGGLGGTLGNSTPPLTLPDGTVFDPGSRGTPSAADGHAGDIRVNTLAGTTVSHNFTLPAPGTLNPYRFYDTNIANIQNGNGATTPNIPGNIEGGVAAYGRITTSGSFDTSGPLYYRTVVASPASIPSNAKAVVWQSTDSRFDSAGYNPMFLTSLGSNVDKPGYKLFRNVNPHNDLYIPAPGSPPFIDPTPQAAQLISSGWMRDPKFVPGATGDQLINTLSVDQTYMTLVEKPYQHSFNMIVGQFVPYSNVRTFYKVYDADQPAPPLYLTDTGLAFATVGFPLNGTAKSFSGIDGETRNATGIHFAYRAGSGNKNISLTASNGGHDDSLMSGQFKSTEVISSFSDLPVDHNGTTFARASIPFSSTLAAAGSTMQHVEIDTDAGSVIGDLTIDVVGPDLSITGGQGDFPQGARGGLFTNFLNKSTYTTLPLLSEVNILGTSITDDSSGLFSIPSSLLDSELSAGELQRLSVSFLGTDTPGTYSATLHVVTDQNADLLRSGQTFDVPLSVTVAPEPAFLSILGFGAIALVRRRR